MIDEAVADSWVPEVEQHPRLIQNRGKIPFGAAIEPRLLLDKAVGVRLKDQAARAVERDRKSQVGLANVIAFYLGNLARQALDGRVAQHLSLIQETPQLPRPRRMLQLPQRLRLDLPDPLAGHRKLLADLFESVVGVHPDPEAHAQHTFLARRERRQNPRRRLLQVLLNGRVQRQDGILVLDEVPELT